MNPSEILDIVRAFFNALKQILIAMGVMKEDTAAESSDEG